MSDDPYMKTYKNLNQKDMGETRPLPPVGVPYRAILLIPGCFLLILGLTLPWPCVSGFNYADCDPILRTWFSPEIRNLALIWFVALLLAITAASINYLKSPLNNIFWLSTWIYLYILTVPRISYDSFLGYSPLLRINQELGGPTYYVLPVSLVTFWLALRPEGLRKKWRLAEVIGLLALIFLIGFFFIFTELRLLQFARTPSPFAAETIFGAGPVLILCGGVLLLALEYLEMRQEKRKMIAEASINAISTLPSRTYKLGYWSALIVTAASLLPLVLALIPNFISTTYHYDVSLGLLYNIFNVILSFLSLVAFIMLMVSIVHIAPVKAKRWAKIGLLFAIMYAITVVVYAYLIPLVLRIFPQLYNQMNTIFPILTKYGAWGAVEFGLVSLAGLFILPVFRRGKVELTIRWCFIILGGLTVVSVIGYLSSSERIPVFPMITSSVAKLIVFPVATALIAVVFRRATEAENS